jgi:hypothetical protein
MIASEIISTPASHSYQLRPEQQRAVRDKSARRAFLPIGGAGAENTWKLELPGSFRQFDYETISDVILHLRYTARDGAVGLKSAAVKTLKGTLNDDTGVPLSRLFSLRHEFPSEWQRLMRAPAASESDPVTRAVDLSIIKARFPFYLAPATLQTVTVAVVVVPIAAVTATGKPPASFGNLAFSLTAGKQSPPPIDISSKLTLGEALIFTSATPQAVAIDGADVWTIGFTGKTDLQALSADMQDFFLVINYTAEFK